MAMKATSCPRGVVPTARVRVWMPLWGSETVRARVMADRSVELWTYSPSVSSRPFSPPTSTCPPLWSMCTTVDRVWGTADILMSVGFVYVAT